MAKILVTGANGFVGKHVVAELLRNNYQVVALGGKSMSALEAAQDLTFVSCNLLESSDTDSIDFTDISGVIHLAGLAAVGPSFDDPAGYLNANGRMQINLMQSALKQKAAPRFIIVSTGALYDPSADLPLSETSQIIPSSPYAVSKLAQENFAQYYTKRGLECIVARPFNHIGPGQNLGFLVPDITHQAIACERGEQTEVKVGNLDAERDYTDVRDIARAYRLLMEKGESGQAYNVCSGKSRSGHEILSAVLSATGTMPAVVQDQSRMRPADNPIIYGDSSKLTAATNWSPAIPFETTIVDIVADWRAR